MTTTATKASSAGFTLDLSEGTIIACLDRSIAVLDPRGVYDAQDTALLSRETVLNGSPRTLNGYVAVLRAGRLTSAGEYIEVERHELEHGAAIYGRKMLEGTAYYTDGATEGWRIQVDTQNMQWSWTRQPDDPSDRLVMRLVTPAPADRFSLWQTGRGATFLSEDTEPLTAPDESELLCVGPTVKNSFRLDIPAGGEVTLRQVERASDVLASERGWRTAEVRAVETTWVLPPVALLQMVSTWGLGYAARDFQGRQSFRPVQATLDFDVFYSRMSLAALPLYLSGGEQQHYVPLSRIGRSAPPAPLLDIALACEFLPLADPRAAGVLMRDTIDRALEDVEAEIARGDGHQDAAVLLLLAGRYAVITGDPDFLGGRLHRLRALAEALLQRRPEGTGLPLLDTADGPAKEIGFISMCYAGLKRLAELEHHLASQENAKRWLTAAEIMRGAALAPFKEGGLLHPGRGVFVHCVVMDKSGHSSVLVRTEFCLRQFVLPCLLGLMEDPGDIERAYDWIDDQFTYATGRGGCSCPPGAERGLFALLDVYLRQKHGLHGGDRVLQLVLDHALDFGVPMIGAPYEARRAPTANFADAAPYIGLVLGQHYGLDYTRQGWVLHNPKPLQNYPLTRVTGLRHKHATFSVTWQGRGRIKRIAVDGRTHRANVLSEVEGDHEVTVYLG